jgi:lysyl-tRNA synthetase class II
MDKAVDVVAERLNELGAPFLALRAGRLNYQRELSMQLQDLLSNKVDLDDGVENSIMCDVSDMEALLKSVKEMENKAEQIIKLENEWTGVNEEIKLEEPNHRNHQYIKSNLKNDEIKSVEEIINILTSNLEKAGFFASLKNSSSFDFDDDEDDYDEE